MEEVDVFSRSSCSSSGASGNDLHLDFGIVMSKLKGTRVRE